LAEQESFICKITATYSNWVVMIFQLCICKWHFDIDINWIRYKFELRLANLFEIYANVTILILSWVLSIRAPSWLSCVLLEFSVLSRFWEIFVNCMTIWSVPKFCDLAPLTSQIILQVLFELSKICLLHFHLLPSVVGRAMVPKTDF